MSCHLHVEDFAVGGLHDPNTGLCRDPTCQWGLVARHPRQQQPSQGTATNPNEKLEIRQQIREIIQHDFNNSLLSPSAYCEEIEEHVPFSITIEKAMPSKASILSPAEFKQITSIAHNENQLVALISPILAKIIQNISNSLILVNCEEYKWIKQHEVVNLRSSYRSSDLKPDLLVTTEGLNIDRPEPSTGLGGMQQFRRSNLTAQQVKELKYGTIPRRARPYLRLILEFTDVNLKSADHSMKRGKLYQYLSHLVRDDPSSHYTGLLCGRDGFLSTTWQGGRNPPVNNLVTWTLPGSVELFEKLVRMNENNVWELMLREALNHHQVRLPVHSAFLGAGRFGHVFSVFMNNASGQTTRSKQSQKRCALKIIKVDKTGRTGATPSQVQSEFNMLNQVKGRNDTVQIQGHLHEIRIQNELVGYSYLMDTIGSPILSTEMNENTMEMILRALELFHEANFYHGDCRIQNILFTEQRDAILFCDFRATVVSKDISELFRMDMVTLICSVLGIQERAIPKSIRVLIDRYDPKSSNKKKIMDHLIKEVIKSLKIALKKSKKNKMKYHEAAAKKVNIDMSDDSVLKRLTDDIGKSKKFFTRTLEDSAKKQQKLADQDVLSAIKLKVVDCGGAGDCFFLAMAAQLNLVNSPLRVHNYSAGDLREIVDAALWIAYLENPGQLFEFDKELFFQVEEYLLQENHEGLWADDFMISTLATALGVRIRIYNRNNLADTYTVGDPAAPFEANLLYTVGLHYQSLEPPSAKSKGNAKKRKSTSDNDTPSKKPKKK